MGRQGNARWRLLINKNRITREDKKKENFEQKNLLKGESEEECNVAVVVGTKKWKKSDHRRKQFHFLLLSNRNFLLQ